MAYRITVNLAHIFLSASKESDKNLMFDLLRYNRTAPVLASEEKFHWMKVESCRELEECKHLQDT